jgi:hypothetical protein
MSMKLEAVSPAEGIGIVRTGQTLRLIRPPYSFADAPIVTEESLQDAIIHHGFSACAAEFAGWEEAIAYLNQQATAARRSLGKDIPDSIPGGAILDVAPPEVLARFLDRVEKEIIPQRLFEHADNFLLALLGSDAASRHAEIRTRAVRLLRHSRNARRRSEEGQNGLASRDIRFVGLEKRGELEWSTRLAETIRERRCVFA